MPTNRTVLGFILSAAFVVAEHPVERVGELKHAAIGEASGIVRSRKHPGIFWVHNDSGNPPALFAVRADGSLVREFAVAVANIDWEDIAADDDGRLYVGDIGNNGGRLPIRAIHRFVEPDPSVEPRGPLKPDRSWYYRLPDRDRFDAESLYLDGETLRLIAKRFDGRDAQVYKLALDVRADLLRPALPEPVRRLEGFTDAATGADLSPDGRRLAVVSTGEVAVFERTPDGFSLRHRLAHPDSAVEAICWDGEDLLLASEGRSLYRIRAAAWRNAPPARTR